MPRPRSSSSSSSSGSVKARVLLDTYSWYEKCNDPTTTLHTASRDEVIDISSDEFKRGSDMVPTALAKSSDKDARAAADPLPLPDDLDDASEDDLRTVATQLGHDVTDDTTRDELVGMVAAAPGYERPQV